jgi:hypothetical protein
MNRSFARSLRGSCWTVCESPCPHCPARGRHSTKAAGGPACPRTNVPGTAANNKLKFSGLQRTFIPAHNGDPADGLFNRLTLSATFFSPRVTPRCRPRTDFRLGGVYNRVMARGWESKSVEEQQSAASTQVESKQRLTPQQAAQKQEREAIALSRRRVVQQLQEVQNPRHRQMLEIALMELDERLARMV